jgi:hypothetical protein
MYIKNQLNPELEPQFHIKFEVEDEKTRQIQVVEFEQTNHCLKRSSQRGINISKIAITLQYGQTYFKQGLNYYILGEKDIPKFLKKEKSHLINTVVITAGDSNQVITCYRSNQPFKKIKIKSNELYKKYKSVA